MYKEELKAFHVIIDQGERPPWFGDEQTVGPASKGCSIRHSIPVRRKHEGREGCLHSLVAQKYSVGPAFSLSLEILSIMGLNEWQKPQQWCLRAAQEGSKPRHSIGCFLLRSKASLKFQLPRRGQHRDTLSSISSLTERLNGNLLFIWS